MPPNKTEIMSGMPAQKDTNNIWYVKSLHLHHGRNICALVLPYMCSELVEAGVSKRDQRRSRIVMHFVVIDRGLRHCVWNVIHAAYVGSSNNSSNFISTDKKTL